MNAQMVADFISQLDVLIDLGMSAKNGLEWGWSQVPYGQAQVLFTRYMAAIDRLSPPGSAYRQDASSIAKKPGDPHMKIGGLHAILQALKSDLEAGYMQSATELIHASTFADFLAMAEHLLSEGYKDAAAVIAGSSLEAHLRNLCVKHSVALDVTTPRGTTPKKADVMNGDLGGADVYNKLDQKSVTAWLDLRNKAAHGRYAEYTQAQVEMLIPSIREFIGRNPA